MEPKAKILELIARLQNIPVGNDSMLYEFLTELKETIHDLFTAESPYLDYLKYIRFKPDAVFVTEKERERSWHDGTAQVDNLLRVLYNDRKVSSQSSVFFSDEDGSPMENAVQQSLGELKRSIIDEHPELEVQQILEPAHTQDPKPTVTGQEKENQVLGTEELSHPEISKVLYVPGSDELVNQDVLDFLNQLHVKTVTIPKVVGQETLMERINHSLDAEFVIFVLSADFHLYSRNQRPVDASVVSSQESVFQLGYLAAKFDRQKMVVLYREEADFLCPTEFFDLFYVPVSSTGTWKNEVLRRMNSKLSIPSGLGLSLEKQAINGAVS